MGSTGIDTVAVGRVRGKGSNEVITAGGLEDVMHFYIVANEGATTTYKALREETDLEWLVRHLQDQYPATIHPQLPVRAKKADGQHLEFPPFGHIDLGCDAFRNSVLCRYLASVLHYYFRHPQISPGSAELWTIAASEAEISHLVAKRKKRLSFFGPGTSTSLPKPLSPAPDTDGSSPQLCDKKKKKGFFLKLKSNGKRAAAEHRDPSAEGSVAVQNMRTEHVTTVEELRKRSEETSEAATGLWQMGKGLLEAHSRVAETSKALHGCGSIISHLQQGAEWWPRCSPATAEGDSLRSAIGGESAMHRRAASRRVNRSRAQSTSVVSSTPRPASQMLTPRRQGSVTPRTRQGSALDSSTRIVSTPRLSTPRLSTPRLSTTPSRGRVEVGAAKGIFPSVLQEGFGKRVAEQRTPVDPPIAPPASLPDGLLPWLAGLTAQACATDIIPELDDVAAECGTALLLAGEMLTSHAALDKKLALRGDERTAAFDDAATEGDTSTMKKLVEATEDDALVSAEERVALRERARRTTADATIRWVHSGLEAATHAVSVWESVKAAFDEEGDIDYLSIPSECLPFDTQSPLPHDEAHSPSPHIPRLALPKPQSMSTVQSTPGTSEQSPPSTPSPRKVRKDRLRAEVFDEL